MNVCFPIFLYILRTIVGKAAFCPPLFPVSRSLPLLFDRQGHGPPAGNSLTKFHSGISSGFDSASDSVAYYRVDVNEHSVPRAGTSGNRYSSLLTPPSLSTLFRVAPLYVRLYLRPDGRFSVPTFVFHRITESLFVGQCSRRDEVARKRDRPLRRKTCKPISTIPLDDFRTSCRISFITIYC